MQGLENEGILYVFPIFQPAAWEQKIRCPAADDLFRVSLAQLCAGGNGIIQHHKMQLLLPLLGVDGGQQHTAALLAHRDSIDITLLESEP